MSALCFHCGECLDDGTPVRRGLWLIGPTVAFRDTEQMPLTRAQCRVLYAIARANGARVTHRDLPGCGEGTFAHHLRDIRKAVGDHFPVRLVGDRGYGWAAGA